MQSEPILTRYLKSGRGSDFERIVEAHGGMVFGTALRSTRSRALAEEVTQEVFITLARKAAGIREPHKLAAWLHRTAIQCAANTNRREANRRKAMETYSDEIRDAKFDSAEDRAAWQRALPHLDRAIEELPTPDREAVIMRFYEGSSYRDIAELLNKSEGSCKKQVYRALEKLAGLLKKRGITVPPTVLGVGLGGYLAHDALPMAAGQVTQLAMAARTIIGVTALPQILVVMSGYKLTILAASAAALIPIGWQWQANRAQAISLPSTAGVARVSPQLEFDTGLREVDADTAQPRTSDELLAEMRALSESGNPFRINTKLRHLMFSLRDDEMEAALAALHRFLAAPRASSVSYAVASALFTRWVALDPVVASRHAMDIAEFRLRSGALDGLVQGWVTRDPESLQAFVEDLPPGEERTKIETHYWRYLTEAAPETAADKALAIADAQQRTELLNRVLLYWWQDPGPAIEWLEENVHDGLTRDGWLNRLLDSLAESHPAEAFGKSMRLLNGTQQKSTIGRVMRHWADVDPESALAALLELPGTVRDGHIIEALGKGLSDLTVIDGFMERFPAESDRTAFVNGLASGLSDHRHEMRNVTPENIEKIRQLVEDLPPGEDRFSARWNLAGAWAALDYEQARDWYHRQPGVKESMKEKFVRTNGR